MQSFPIIPALLINLLPAVAAWALHAYARRGPGARRALAAALPATIVLACSGLRGYLPLIAVLGWAAVAAMLHERQACRGNLAERPECAPPPGIVAAWCVPPAFFTLLIPLRIIHAEPLLAGAVAGLASVAARITVRCFAPGAPLFPKLRKFPQAVYSRWGGLREPPSGRAEPAAWTSSVLYPLAAVCCTALLGWAAGGVLFRHVWAVMAAGAAGSFAAGIADVLSKRRNSLLIESTTTSAACIFGFIVAWLAG